MTKKHLLKFTLPLAAVAMFASASVSNAATVVYNLTSDGAAVVGTLSWDSTVGVSFADGGISAFSFTRADTTDTYDSVNDIVSEVVLTHSLGTPLTLLIDLDDADESGTFLFTESVLDFDTGLGQLNSVGSGSVSVTGAALTAVPEPGSLALLGLSGLALLLRRRR